MLRLSKRLIVYMLLLAMLSMSLSGCKKSDEPEDAAEQAADDGQVDGDDTLDNAIADVIDPNAGQEQTPELTRVDNPDVPEAPAQQAIAERSPVEVTRIDMGKPEKKSSSASKSGNHNHEKAPKLFEISPCQVEVDGRYLIQMSRDLLTEINSRRRDYDIDSLEMTTSLMACADSRCKELTYFVGHFRPDGSAFSSVSPEGYIQGELIAVDYRTVDEIMETFFSVNSSRYEMMNPDYTQCGISIYDINSTYYVAVEFAY